MTRKNLSPGNSLAPDERFLLFWDGYGLSRPGSGIFYHGKRLAAGLDRLGVRPQIITDMVDQPVLSPGIRQLTLPRGRFSPEVFRTNKLLWPGRTGRFMARRYRRHQGPPMIYHGLSNFNLPGGAGFRAKFRTVLTVHDVIPLLPGTGLPATFRFQMRRAMARSLPGADVIICVSEWTRKTLLDLFPTLQSRILVIPNGFIPPGELTETNRPLPSQTLRLLTVSRYESYKRLDWWISLVERRGREWELDLVTDMRGISMLEKRYAGLIGAGCLRLHTGLTDADLQVLYRRASVYVHPSLYEGFCLPVTEAFSFGLPVVYRSGSGIDEAAGRTVATGLAATASDDDWVSAVEQGGRRRLEPGFQRDLRRWIADTTGWEGAAQTLLQVYDNLID